jgi:hypothetical protein
MGHLMRPQNMQVIDHNMVASFFIELDGFYYEFQALRLYVILFCSLQGGLNYVQ